MRHGQFPRRARPSILSPALVVLLILSLVMVDVSPALARAAAPASPTVETIQVEQAVDAALLQFTGAAGQVGQVDLLAARERGRRDRGDVSTQAVPAIAAVLGAVAICAGGAAANVGFGTLERLIAQGNVGQARELLADAIVGCVGGIITPLAVRACRAVSPCRRALDAAVSRAVDRIIRELRD